MAIGTIPNKGGQLEKVRKDAEGIIKLHGIKAVLTREVSTYGNSGEITDVSYERYNIYMMISDNVRKNRQFSDAGLSIQGEIDAFFLYEYPKEITRSKKLQIQTGDRIKDQEDRHWRVEEIMKQPEYEGQEAFRKAKLRRIA